MLRRRQADDLIEPRLAWRAAALAAGALVFAAVAPSPLRADPAAATPAAAGDTAAAEAGPLQEIVVTATRHEENLSKVPLSVTALTQDAMDMRGIKDFQDVARFTPGVQIDNSGTNNIAIRGIASTGGAGTTGIYLDDTPIQMRALAFNPDEALPKSFDLDRVEVLRGPQGTLFGSGSEGGTVRYITTQPALTGTSFYSRDEVSYTEGGAPSYEAGIAAGTPLIDGVLGVRVTAWYRYDGGWIDRIDPYSLELQQKNANYDQTKLFRIATIWEPAEGWDITPSFYYQDRYRNDVENYWGIYSNPSSNRYVDANPTQRTDPDIYYVTALKMQGDVGFAKLISNTSYFRRSEVTGYDGTIYNLGFYQEFFNGGLAANGGGIPSPLISGTGLHLPTCAQQLAIQEANGQPAQPCLTSYYSPASINNDQQNFAQEIRLQSNDPSARLIWTTGLFFGMNHQQYLEQIHDPQLNAFSQAVAGLPYGQEFLCTPPGCATPTPTLYDPRFPFDSYFLQTFSEDKQLAWFGEGTYSFTDQWKTTVGLRVSRTEFSFNTLTGGPQLFLPPQANEGDKKETSVTPKVSLSYQYDPHDLYYFTYAKGFRPGGANNPVPYAACSIDFQNFGIKNSPATFNSDTVNSFEIGSKNNLDNRVKIASSIYYIRWNNIQQTVVPPICEISFIDNLGQAVAKGADVQADIAFTDDFTAEIAAGYTDARYTKNATLSSSEVTGPVVSAGDAITGQSGQPGAPYTVSVGLEYKFEVLAHESFARVDDEYESRAKWPSPGQDPRTLQYDPNNYTLSSTHFASFRAGTSLAGWQLEAFIDNLTDSHTITNYEWSINGNPNAGTEPYSRLQREFSFRPRTFGLTFIYRSK
ncbi:MAG: TonB-dependent receptor [Steroidobacteraceae bacterium]|jgi:iron complex outermembrane recepter protein